MSKKFKRRKKPRPVKPTCLIVCEGDSEEIYFKNLKRYERITNINVEIVNPNVSTPRSICRYAQKERIKRQYDFAFCVFDRDVDDKISIKKEADRSKMEVITSTPCFEIWFLIHFKYTSREFYHCHELINTELKKYVPDYDKTRFYHSKKKFYEFLRKDLMNAVHNAKKLDDENQKSGKAKGTSTGIYKIIEKIEIKDP